MRYVVHEHHPPGITIKWSIAHEDAHATVNVPMYLRSTVEHDRMDELKWLPANQLERCSTEDF